MINRFIKVNDFVFRGSAPSRRDLILLKKKFGINKIISLDEDSGNHIKKACKMLGIKQIIIPLDHNRSGYLKLLSNNIKDLLETDGPTYVHCLFGKDRVGMLIAIYKCKYYGVSYEDAINEAENIGLGVGCSEKYTNMLKSIIKASCDDVNDANSSTVSMLDNVRDQMLEMEAHNPLSMSVYLDHSKHPIYNVNYEQSGTRQDRDNEAIKHHISNKSVPQVGIFNNDAGIRGAGPVENAGGFVYQ